MTHSRTQIILTLVTYLSTGDTGQYPVSPVSVTEVSSDKNQKDITPQRPLSNYQGDPSHTLADSH